MRMNFVVIGVVSMCASLANASGTQCAQLIGSCEYYECVEAQLLSCGDGGYIMGYGHHFCKKFDAVVPRAHINAHEKDLFPSEWESWLDKTAFCLHSAIDNHLGSNPQSTCESLREAAFASHAGCYTQGESFCFLPPRQVANIGKIISVRGFSQRETRRQVAQTADICVRQLDERIASERSALNRIELSSYRNLWSVVAQTGVLF